MLTVGSRADIDLAAFRRVAWGSEGIQLSERARIVMATARGQFLEFLRNEPSAFVYGVTTGAGDRSKVELTPEQAVAGGVPPLLGGPSWGEALPPRITRGIVLTRLANWVDGHAAIRPELAEAVTALLDRELPTVPVTGHGGSGEIVALAHLFGPFARTFGFAVKEPVSLINGAPCAAALAADSVLAGQRRLRLAEAAFALAIEAAAAPLAAYATVLGELWGHDGDSAVLQRLGPLLRNDVPRVSTQAAVSMRIIPRELGRAETAISEAGLVSARMLNAVTENPVYLPPSSDHPHGQVLSNGGFHDAHAPALLDCLAGAWANLAVLAVRVGQQLLLADERDGDDARPSNVMMVLQARAEDARSAAKATVLSMAGLGQNDVASSVFPAWQAENRAAASVDGALALLAVMASRRLTRTGARLTPALQQFLDEIVSRFPTSGDRWDRGNDGAALNAYVAAGNHGAECSWSANV
jgi:histidine ammonia-lyase